MSVGPNRFSALAVGRTGARARKYCSSKITCSIKLAPRPPYSSGQEIPTQPAACIVFCHAMRFSNVSRSGATRWSAASSTQISASRFASSQWRNSARNTACSGLSAKSIAVLLLIKDVERQEGADDEVRHVDQFTQFQVDGDAADRVGLLPVPAALDQHIDHRQQRIAGAQCRVFALIGAVLADRQSGRCEEALGGGKLGGKIIVVTRKAREADAAALSFTLVYREAHEDRPGHLDRGTAGLPVALREMRVADREEGAVDKDRQHEARALAQLLDVEIAAVLARRDRAQRLGGDWLRRRHRTVFLGRQHHPAAAEEVGFTALDRLAPRRC